MGFPHGAPGSRPPARTTQFVRAIEKATSQTSASQRLRSPWSRETRPCNACATCKAPKSGFWSVTRSCVRTASVQRRQSLTRACGAIRSTSQARIGKIRPHENRRCAGFKLIRWATECDRTGFTIREVLKQRARLMLRGNSTGTISVPYGSYTSFRCHPCRVSCCNSKSFYRVKVAL